MVKNGNKLVFDQESSGKDTSYNKRTNEKIWLRQENGVYLLDLMVAHPQVSNDRSTDPHFSSAGMTFTTLVSPIETHLRKVSPELCVDDVPERVAEVEMSSSNLVRVNSCLIGCNSLTKIWSMRKNRESIVWKFSRIYRMVTKEERELLHKEKELDRYLNPGFPAGRRFRNTN